MAAIKVLLVEDEEDIRRLIKRKLEAEGHIVTEAENGMSALRMIERDRPDIILLDIMLPELDGYEVCRKIKGDYRYRDIPVVMVTCKAADYEILEGKEAGADRYLTKPFNLEDLIEAVEELAKKEEDEEEDE